MLSDTPKTVGAVGFFDIIHVSSEWGKAFVAPTTPEWVTQGIGVAALVALLVLTAKIVWVTLPPALRAALWLHRGVGLIGRSAKRLLVNALASLWQRLANSVRALFGKVGKLFATSVPDDGKK